MLRYLVQRLAGRGARDRRSASSTAWPAVAADLEHLRTVVVPDAEPGDDLPDLPFDVLDGAAFFDGATPADDLPGPEPPRHRRARSTRRAPPGPSKGVLVPWAELNEFATHAARRDARATAAATTPCTRPSTCPGSRRSTLSARYRGHIVIRETFSLTEFWTDIRRYGIQARRARRPDGRAAHAAPRRSRTTPTRRSRSVYMGPLIPQVEEFKARFGVRGRHRASA